MGGLGAAVGGLGVLSTIIDVIGQVLAGAFQVAIPIAKTVCVSFLTLSLMWASWTAAHGAIMRNAWIMALKSGFFLTIIGYADVLYKFLLKAMVGLGLTASASSMSADQFLRSPDALIYRGMATANNLFDLAGEACKLRYLGCFGAIDIWSPIWFAGWGVEFIFLTAAVLVMCAALLASMCFVLGIFLLPAELFEPTSGYGRGPFTVFLHSGMQLAVLAFVTNVMGIVATKMTVGTVPGVDSSLPYFAFIAAFVSLLAMSSALTMVATNGGMQAAGSLFGIGGGMGGGVLRGGTQRMHNIAEQKAIETAGKLYDAGKVGLRAGSKRFEQQMTRAS